MPEERKDQSTSERKSDGKDGKSNDGKDRSTRSSLERSSGERSSRSSRSNPQDKLDKLVKDSWKSHAGWLEPILTSLSVPPLQATLIAGLIYLLLLIVSPPVLQPHLSAPITLLIPVINSLRAARVELDYSPAKSHDSPQWCMYWIGYVAAHVVKGWVGVFRPGWKWGCEVGLGVGLVVLGGGWFGRSALRYEPSAKTEHESRSGEDGDKDKEKERQRQKEKERQRQKEKEKAKESAKAK